MVKILRRRRSCWEIGRKLALRSMAGSVMVVVLLLIGSLSVINDLHVFVLNKQIQMIIMRYSSLSISVHTLIQ